MTREELLEAIDNADIDREVVALLIKHPPETECVLMGPMGQIDVMPLRQVSSYASDHYDLYDYICLHVCTLAEYVAETEKQNKESSPIPDNQTPVVSTPTVCYTDPATQGGE